MTSYDFTIPGPVKIHYNVENGLNQIYSYNDGMSQRRYRVSDAVRRTPGYKPGKWANPLPYSMDAFGVDGASGFMSMVVRDDGRGPIYHHEYTGYLYNRALSFGFSYKNWSYAYGFSPTEKTRQYNADLIKTLQKLKNSKVSLAQAFAEREQTVELFAGVVKRVIGALGDLEIRDYRGVARHLGLSYESVIDAIRPTRRRRNVRRKRPDRLHNEWLALQYGWMPLLGDVYGSCEALAKADVNDPQRYVVTVGAKSRMKSKTLDSYVVDDIANDARNLKIYLEHRERCDHSIRLDYYYRNPITQSLASLGITNPFLVAWDLLPYSFVVDWFLPIGEWLGTLDADVGFDFKAGSHTFFTETAIKRYYLAGPLPIGFTGVSRIGNAVLRDWTYRMRREVFYSTPHPTLPRLKNPFSFKHLANAVALLKGFIK